MYVRKLRLTNIRSIQSMEMSFTQAEAPGWHVLLGANGAGKSSVVRSLALAVSGPKEAAALRQTWTTWIRSGEQKASIDLTIECDDKDIFTGQGRKPKTKLVEANIQLQIIESTLASNYGGTRAEVVSPPKATLADRSIWGANAGWFSASFGPFRRFTGGDREYDRLFYSNPRLAAHLSAFGEDVALTEGLRWLRDLRVKQLEKSDQVHNLLQALIDFLNASDLLPHGARVLRITSDDVEVADGSGTTVAVEQLSDGYRSILSMIFEILRQMTRSYGPEEVAKALQRSPGSVDLPGVIAIDEVDAHLHPSWQRDIGPWFSRCFPRLQFFVTTHSPIVCRSAKTVWRLPSPGSEELAGRITGPDYDRLVNGSILDALSTEFFGRDIARSPHSKEMLTSLALLNRKALRGHLSSSEQTQMDKLRTALPTRAATTE